MVNEELLVKVNNLVTVLNSEITYAEFTFNVSEEERFHLVAIHKDYPKLYRRWKVRYEVLEDTVHAVETIRSLSYCGFRMLKLSRGIEEA